MPRRRATAAGVRLSLLATGRMEGAQRRAAAAITILVLLAGCAPVPPAPSGPSAAIGTPSPRPTEPPTATPAATQEPATLRIAGGGDLAGGPSDAARGADAIRIAGLVHDGLYGLDARLRPVPVLASGLPTVSADGLSWTVRLRDGVRFHDGTPLTGEDVVATYRLALSPRCPYGPGGCLSDALSDVRAIDPATVTFMLPTPDPGFAVDALRLGIEPKAAIDTAYRRFTAGFGPISAADTAGYLEAVATERARPTGPDGADGRPTVDLARLRADGETLLRRASVALPDPADHTTAGGLDAAGYLDEVVARVRAIDATFTDRPDDALAAAYPFLETARAPIGTGPFRWVSPATDGSVELAANPAYVLGAPAIERLVISAQPDDVAAAASIREGSTDWRPALTGAAAVAAMADPGPGVRAVTYPDLGFYGLTFNLHPEAKGLFRQREVRQALALCFDHAAAVATATGGSGRPIDTEIPTMSWAYPTSGLTTYPLDRERAKALLESAGWKRGADGIYARGGRRLSTVVPVRADAPDRVAWLRAVSDAVRDCGIDLRPGPVDFDAILSMLAVYPHVNAADRAGGKPFDAYMGGLDVGLDPDPFRLYHSSQCSSAERPDSYAFGCYANPAVDRLIDAARRETDLDRRATLYRDYAARISQDLPVIYAWSDLRTDLVGPAVGTTAPGGLPLDTPTWQQPMERLTITR